MTWVGWSVSPWFSTCAPCRTTSRLDSAGRRVYYSGDMSMEHQILAAIEDVRLAVRNELKKSGTPLSDAEIYAVADKIADQLLQAFRGQAAMADSLRTVLREAATDALRAA